MCITLKTPTPMFNVTTTTPDMKGISRIDSGSTHGWFVRAYKNGKTFSKLFSDGKWKGSDEALNTARQYRGVLLDRLTKIPTKARGRRIVFRDSRNTTGMLGVSRSTKRTPSGVVSESYAVTWRPEPGVQSFPPSVGGSRRQPARKKSAHARRTPPGLERAKAARIMGPKVYPSTPARVRKTRTCARTLLVRGRVETASRPQATMR